MKLESIQITGVPSAADISKVVEMMVLRAVYQTTGFQSLTFVCSSCPSDLFTEKEMQDMLEKGYKFYELDMGAPRWSVMVHKLQIDDDNGIMSIVGKVQLGDNLYLSLQISCDLTMRCGLMSNFNLLTSL